MVDAIFEDPRLAQVYDPLDPDRSDLDVYVALVDKLAARSVLDIGCGTGTFACMLARRGIDVTAVDPAAASLDVARSKAGAEAVRWVHGDATTLPPISVDAAFMTANVAQVFLTDSSWAATLRAVGRAVRRDGWLVFETRDPARRAWEQWTPELTHTMVDVPGVGVVESWEEVTDVSGDLVTFRSMTAFRRDAVVIESVSTLRFRDRHDVEASLLEEGFQLAEVRDAPDRPDREFVFLARRPRCSWATSGLRRPLKDISTSNVPLLPVTSRTAPGGPLDGGRQERPLTQVLDRGERSGEVTAVRRPLPRPQDGRHSTVFEQGAGEAPVGTSSEGDEGPVEVRLARGVGALHDGELPEIDLYVDERAIVPHPQPFDHHGQDGSDPPARRRECSGPLETDA